MQKQQTEEDRNSLITVMQKAQQSHGYLSEDLMKQISSSHGVALSRVYSIATFYKSFNLDPPGKNSLMVCLGTACHVKNSGSIAESISRHLGLDTSEGTTPDKRFSLKKVRCLGCCSIAPVIKINEKIEGNVSQKKALDILKGLESEK